MIQSDFHFATRVSHNHRLLAVTLMVCAIALSVHGGEVITPQTKPATISAIDLTAPTQSGGDLANGIVNLSESISISPTTLANGKVGVPYVTQQLSATGGTAPYTFTLTSNTSLPPGLTLSPSGAISGTPTGSGFYFFVVKATDSTPAGNGGPFSGSKSYFVSMDGATIVITPASLPAAIVGAAYSNPLIATGGTAPYKFVVTTGSVPTGLTLNADGSFSGLPTTEGDYKFTVKATDSSTSASSTPTFVVAETRNATVVTAPFSASANYDIIVDAVPVFTSGPSASVAFAPQVGGNVLISNVLGQFNSAVLPSDAVVTWNFGDGLPSATGTNVTHTYTVAGDYTVTVTAKNPRSGTTTSATFIAHVTDSTLGANQLRVRSGTIRINPALSRIDLKAVIHLSKNETIGGSMLRVDVNGVTRTFTLNANGYSNFPNGIVQISFRAINGVVSAQEAPLHITITGVDIPAQLANNVAVDAAGLPLKALFQFTFNGQTLTFVSPLKFTKSGLNSTAVFGIH